ncbi:hypothetical protein D3C74_49770 [compost metagenome]
MLTVERLSDNELEKQVWKFYVLLKNDDVVVILDQYELQKRESKRHKFKANIWDRYERLKSSRGGMKVDVVPLPISIEREVRDQVLDGLRVTKEL